MSQRRLSLTLEPRHEGLAVGDILHRELDISAAVIRRIKWLDDGILLDGQRVHTPHKGKAGQVLSALIGETSRRSTILPVKGPLNIVYEDQDFLAIHKEAGVVVHPTHAHKEDTLGNFLLYYYDETGFGGDFHPVHRLDRGTSGLLVVAKHPFAQEQFKEQIHSPVFHREYLALVWGELPQETGRIEEPILLEAHMKRCVHPQGVHALTHYQVLDRGSREGQPLSLVALTLETGRTHQIRVHLSYLGHPLLGDEIYGKGDVLSHSALHAFRLSLHHPVTKEPMSFLAKPPEDFCQVLEESGMALPDCF